MADYYDILGVSKDASDDEIKKAFRKAAHKHHPDKEGGDEQKFKEANEAYQVLSDKTKRAQYDQYGQTFDGAGGPGGGFGGFDFSQFGGQGGGFEFNFGGGEGFSDIFGDVFGGGRRGGRGRDIQTRVSITFAEMISGVTKDVSFRADRTCETCDGTGGKKGISPDTCRTCSGSGHIQKVVRTMLGNVAQNVVCDTCRGTGKTYAEKCDTCHGAGIEQKSVTESIEIPAGIDNGQTIALGGRGEAGQNGASAGDLLVTVSVTPDERFERDGFTINSDIHISFPEAALGAKVDVETVEGTVTMKIPAGTQSREVFRIKGKGIPVLQGSGRGDHMVRVIVDIPEKLSRTQKKAIEKLSDVL